MSLRVLVLDLLSLRFAWDGLDRNIRIRQCSDAYRPDILEQRASKDFINNSTSFKARVVWYRPTCRLLKTQSTLVGWPRMCGAQFGRSSKIIHARPWVDRCVASSGALSMTKVIQ